MSTTLYDGAVRMALPEGWQDHSVYTFVAPEPVRPNIPTLVKVAPLRANVVVVRAGLPQESLVRFAQAQLAESKRELPGFSLQREGEVTLAGQTAFEARYVFTLLPENLVVWQRQTFLVTPRWLYTITCTREAHAENNEALFDGMLTSLQLE